MPAGSSTNQLCLVSMILGIASVAGSGCCFIVGWPLAVGGIATGFVGLSQVRDRPSEGRGMAIAGIACGAVGAVLPILLFVVQLGTSMAPFWSR